jgi:ABC-type nitrate/sulfonate/bicarbonate transport system permease component
VSGLVIAPAVSRRRAARSAGDWLPALALFVLAIAAWEGAIAAFHIQQFLLPRPGIGQFVARARCGEELKSARAAVAP